MRTAGVLLIGGALAFVTGAAIPVRWLEVWFSGLERHLELISQHRRSWAWLNGFMIAAVLLTAAGFSVMAAQLGHPALIAAAATFAIGSVMWILVATYRTTTSVWVADQMSETGRVPEVFKFRLWHLQSSGDVHPYSGFPETSSVIRYFRLRKQYISSQFRFAWSEIKGSRRGLTVPKST